MAIGRLDRHVAWNLQRRTCATPTGVASVSIYATGKGERNAILRPTCIQRKAPPIGAYSLERTSGLKQFARVLPGDQLRRRTIFSPDRRLLVDQRRYRQFANAAIIANLLAGRPLAQTTL